MLKRMLTTALIAGAAAGMLAALLHFALLQDQILLAERYESGELVHFAGAAAQALSPDHPAATPDLQRNALTVGFSALIHVAYALILVAGFALAAQFGRRVGAAEGALWGMAGFIAVQMAPAMGLPPELPGTPGADLAARQFWWWGTVVATGGGLALIAFGWGRARVGLAVALLAAPHLIGAPRVEGFSGTVPPELAAGFSASVLGAGLVVWVVLGALAGRLWSAAEPS